MSGTDASMLKMDARNISEKSSTAMDIDDDWGEENGLMKKFFEDFDLDGIGEEDSEEREETNANGPNKRGRTIKKRRKQGISPNDPRKYYTDRIAKALCTGDIENVRAVMERYHEPDCIYIQRFTNNTPDLPGYREIRGRDQMLAFFAAFLASSPDCVVKVTDRQLNVYQDGSSYLVSKINFSGAWLFRIFFSNIVRRTRAFFSRTFFNRPSIFNPFRSNSATASSSSTFSASTNDSSSVSTATSTPSYHKRKHSDNNESDEGTYISLADTAAHTSCEQSFAASSTSPLVQSKEQDHTDKEVKYMNCDFHLIEGKASDYESDARSPTPLSPLSTSTSQLMEKQTSMDTIQSGDSKASRKSALSMKLSNVEPNAAHSDSSEVLEAEKPWEDLPFSIARDEQVSSAPIPAPAALIVTQQSEVSVVQAQPKPFRVNVAISHVAHINAAGRIYKTEMFLKAEVSVSWWASAKAKAEAAEEELDTVTEDHEEEYEEDEIDDQSDR